MIQEKNTMANLSVYQPNIDSSQTLLNDLKSTSKVARWRLVFWVVATCAYAFDVILDLAYLALEALVAKSRYGTLPWYVTKAKEFQYGDALTLVDGEWIYSPVNPANQVVKLAASEQGIGIVNVKVATISSGVKQPLNPAQETAFKTYINRVKPAGIRVNVINSLPDDLKLTINVNYDPLVLTSTGELISTPGVFPVNDALELYLTALQFNGSYERQHQEDYLQAAKGVGTAYITSAEARYGLNPFTAFSQRYLPFAGYLVIHPSTVINYTPIV